VRKVAREIYGADDITGDQKLRNQFKKLEEQGYGHLPVCLAKTQYSLSTDPKLKGRPQNFDVPVRAVRLSAGAGFIVVLTGDIVTMPGLPRVPAAEAIDLDERGQITGLF
jgi:formate--tetrahydrofolate ligase